MRPWTSFFALRKPSFLDRQRSLPLLAITLEDASFGNFLHFLWTWIWPPFIPFPKALQFSLMLAFFMQRCCLHWDTAWPFGAWFCRISEMPKNQSWLEKGEKNVQINLKSWLSSLSVNCNSPPVSGQVTIYKAIRGLINCHYYSQLSLQLPEGLCALHLGVLFFN